MKPKMKLEEKNIHQDLGTAHNLQGPVQNENAVSLVKKKKKKIFQHGNSTALNQEQGASKLGPLCDSRGHTPLKAAPVTPSTIT